MNLSVSLEQAALRDDPFSVVSRRRIPRMYIVDAIGEVVLHDWSGGRLLDEPHRVVRRLLASRADEDVLLGLAGERDLLRVVRLVGEDTYYAVFVEAFATRSPVDEAAARFNLSKRERDILTQVLRGASTSEIAERLFIAECTVTTHVRNIGIKMNAPKRKEIVASVLGTR
jgi:DNA-binding NarL/FixJ family response regulator